MKGKRKKRRKERRLDSRRIPEDQRESIRRAASSHTPLPPPPPSPWQPSDWARGERNEKRTRAAYDSGGRFARNEAVDPEVGSA